MNNEGYLCKRCQKGKVRPIQFSLKQAIINCDYPDCVSYLDKYPWECIITRPILESSNLCKYEKDSICSSSDSSGVHSDLGSSGVSQYSATDREVETLLQKPYTRDFDFESFDKSHIQQWQSGTTTQEQEPFVALDDKIFLTDMPSHSNEDIFENKFNHLTDTFQKGNTKNQQELFELLNDSGLGSSSCINPSQSKDTHLRSNVDSELESWLFKLEPSELLENSSLSNFEKLHLGNGDFSNVSPSKAIIPSLNSAFSEVSPSKIFPHQVFNTHEPLKKSDDLKTKESSVLNSFLSPASSGFNEDYGDHAINKYLPSTEEPSLNEDCKDHTTNKCLLSTTLNEDSGDHTADKYLPSTGFSLSEDCGDHTANNYLLSSKLSPPYELSPIELQNSSSSSPLEQKYITSALSNEVSNSIESQANTIEQKDVTSTLSNEASNSSESQGNIVGQDITSTLSNEASNSAESQVDIKLSIEEEKTVDVSPKLNKTLANNLSAKRKNIKKSSRRIARNETKFKSVVTDPWSVPEMYIDELNIEVVLKNESVRTTPPNTKPEENQSSSHSGLGSKEYACSNGNVDVTLDQNINKTVPSFKFCSSIPQSDSSQLECQSTTEPVPPAAQDNIHQPIQQSSVNDAAVHVVDLYKPVTLLPEVIDHHEYFDATAPNFSDSLIWRLSVGYKTEDVEAETHSLCKPDIENVKGSNDSSKYFSSILSNIDFDENFCVLEDEGRGSRLEDLVTSKFLSAGSDSEGLSLENDNNNNNSYNDYDNKDDCKTNILFLNSFEETPVKMEPDADEVDDPLGDTVFKTEEFKTEEYESESEIPIITIDENDDLKLFIPTKSEVKSEKDIEFWNHNLISMQDYSRRKRKLKQPKNKNAKRPKILRKEASEYSQIPLNTCGNNLNVIDTQDHLYSRPSVYNVNKKSFTLFHPHEKFGNLKSEPEYFESFLKGRDDSLDSYSNIEERNSPVGFLREKHNSVERHTKNVAFVRKKSEKCNNLKNGSYRREVMEPCCDNHLSSEFDTAFVKPFNNLPSKQNRRKQNFKSQSRNKSQPLSSVSSLGDNPSVPDVLNMLKESGWIITPCNPVINYNIPEHATSPTVVPIALQNQYGNTGSDVVLWSLTDREVAVPHREKIQKKRRNLNKPYTLFRENCNIENVRGRKLCKFSSHNFLKRENHSFNNFNNFHSFQSHCKSKKVESKSSPLGMSDRFNLLNKNGLKAVKTNDGLMYIQPNFIKKEPIDNFDITEKESDSFSVESEELPDDHLAYQEAVKNGYNVSAPPPLPNNVYLPPLPSVIKQKKKLGRKFHGNLKPYVSENNNNNYKNSSNNTTTGKNSSNNTITSTPEVRRLQDPVQEKAQNEIKTIVSERPPNEVPNVVCMNIEGKLYVYHRKDS